MPGNNTPGIGVFAIVSILASISITLSMHKIEEGTQNLNYIFIWLFKLTEIILQIH